MWLNRNRTQAEKGVQGVMPHSVLLTGHLDPYGRTELESASRAAVLAFAL